MAPGWPFWHYALGVSIASLVLQSAGMAQGRVARRRLGERSRLLGPLLAMGLWMMLVGA